MYFYNLILFISTDTTSGRSLPSCFTPRRSKLICDKNLLSFNVDVQLKIYVLQLNLKFLCNNNDEDKYELLSAGINVGIKVHYVTGRMFRNQVLKRYFISLLIKLNTIIYIHKLINYLLDKCEV